jgi:superfamily II DNA or RNA helicase
MPKTKTSKFRSFDDAKQFMHMLGLKSRFEWNAWKKTDQRPLDIPLDPRGRYKDEWISWGDWLGTNYISTARRVYRDYESTKKYIQNIKIQSSGEYLEWSKTKERPEDIPASPSKTYKDIWTTWGDFLGNGYVSTTRRKYRDFDLAKKFVQELQLEKKDDYFEWVKAGKKPNDIPGNPSATYKKLWTSWGDFLGTGKSATFDREYLSFEEARACVRSLKLGSREAYLTWIKSADRREDIPANPPRSYKAEWKSWGDFLGTDRVATQNRVYRSFVQARNYVRLLKLSSKADFANAVKLGEIPEDIPRDPSGTYQSEWISWGDWLGFYSAWTKNALIGFIKSLYPILPNLEPSELYSILRNNNCLNAIEQLGEDSPLRQLIDSTLHGHLENNAEIFKEIEKLEKQLKGKDEELLGSDTSGVIAEEEISKEIIPTEDDVEELPRLTPSQILENLDHLENVLGISDEDTVEFLINKSLGRIWGEILRSSDPDAQVAMIRDYSGAKHSSVVRERYLEQYSGASSLPIPTGYAFKKNGEPLKPNLMQRLVAYRVLKDYRIGNWSGTGAGKTLGAILASRVIDAKLTVIIGLNNTILDEKSGWAAEIRNAFPSSNILIKEKRDIQFSDTQPNYLLLNYEAFQQNDSRDLVHEIIDHHKIDLIVLDEIHSAKSKQNQDESKRRQLINYLLQRAKEINPDVRVLGMSATPVLNSLDEAVSLIEMIKGREYAELETSPKLSNALAIHEQLVINGIRYMPNYAMELKEHPIEITDNSIIEDLFKAGKGQILQIETALLQAKLRTIVELCKPGTIIYSIYVESIFDTLVKAVKAAGMTVGIFNGDDKTGLDNFKTGKVDVLLGSSALGTGVDGLQYVCNRLIIVCLPWTSAAYEQLIGRIYRQGSVFTEVDVFIPQIVLNNNGESWSWDKQRLARIKYKKTLADAAVDGNVPEANLASQSAMMAEAKNALKDWIARLESGEIRQLNRAELKVPLPPEIEKKALHRYGDFSAMNQRFNSSKSSTMHDRLEKDPEEFYLYHTLYRKARETWTEIPFQVIAEQINKRPDWVIGDFGCGEALLSKSVRNKMYSFDHVAINPSVMACDMSNTGLNPEILDVAVFSLSLMGVNWADYLKEAYRILRSGGLLKIAEPASSWSDDSFIALKNGIESAGFEILGDGKLSSKFIYFDAVKPL